jgi:NADH-quinone oxidoreductase subunit N
LQASARRLSTKGNGLTGVNSDFKQKQLWTLSALFIQFWASFLGAILLVYVSLRFGYLYGSLNWCDLNIFYKLTENTSYSYWKYINYLGASLLIYGFLLKAGVFPYYFWKPELYKNIAWEGMLWYVTLYTFAFLFLLINILTNYLSYLYNYWYFIIWIFALISFIFLSNVLFIITELKVFLTYMSVFHTTYIIINTIVVWYISMINSYVYLIIYILLMLHIFSIIFVIKDKTLWFLTDLQNLSSISLISFSFICVFAAMSGIPPFLGFWAKISVIISLINSSEFLLAILALACGLFLMYFYLQNYRFNTNITKSFINNQLYLLYDATYIFIFLILGVFINFIAIFFINELWNFCILFNNINLFELW